MEGFDSYVMQYTHVIEIPRFEFMHAPDYDSDIFHVFHCAHVNRMVAYEYAKVVALRPSIDIDGIHSTRPNEQV